ncbi:MAG: prolipoprotein diacylglyceryl transferase [Treponemataceae bacterium]|nr:prolipoprotein diacylglyceryl transferase [Treponemataceae bacterium]
MPLFINYPSWIHPEIFPNVPFLGVLRWYGLMYIFAFATAYGILTLVRKEGALDREGHKVSDDELFSFFAAGVIGLLLGARIFSCLIYDPSHMYIKQPWLIFWPFQNGHFTGLAGMSYHGGFIGGLLGMLIWCLVKKQPVWKWVDAMCIAIPLGYTFGRLGNFLNGELFGRITTMPWGMVFPNASRFSASMPWVQEFAEKCGMVLAENTRFVNLPRHPSQLYEAFFEGIVTFVILFSIRKKKPFDGFIGAMYAICYGVFRFVIEYFREPDADMGYKISKNPDAPLYLNTSLANISTGQILCMLMILTGIGIIVGIMLYKRFHKESGKSQEKTEKTRADKKK